MDILSKNTLGQVPNSVAKPNYDCDAIQTSVLHFGVGNFHRAHQAAYCEKLLNLGHINAGIVGVSLRSASMRDSLIEQDFLYSLTTLNSEPHVSIMGVLQNMLVAPESPETVVENVANSNIQLVTTTITEKGYCLVNNKLDTSTQDIQLELLSLEKPKTIYGFLAAGLIKRFQSNQSPLTILCCDNVNQGGLKLKTGVEWLLNHHAPKVMQWCEKSVAFISSMVDRITPATDESLIRQTSEITTMKDSVPVSAEPFSQWVIENNFAGEKLPFDSVGALFVENIEEYETVKLRFLNASHSIFATIGYLFGDDYIHQAVERKNLLQLTQDYLLKELIPVTHAPRGINLYDYTEQTLQRFSNEKVPYRTLQVGSDSSLKIQQRWFPSIDNVLKTKQPNTAMAFILASWVVFIAISLKKGTLNDPNHQHFEAVAESESEPYIHAMLKVANANNFAFFNDNAFMSNVAAWYDIIQAQGIANSLSTYLKTQ